MHRKMKYVLIFFLGFITPLLIIIFLGGVLYVNSVERLRNIDVVVIREVNTFFHFDRITLYDLYQASIFNEGQLVSNVKTGINNFQNNFGSRAERLLRFRADRVQSKVSFIQGLRPYIEKLMNFEVDFNRPNISLNEKLSTIDSHIQNINELITKLKNSNVSFTEEIQRLKEIKGNLVALKATLTLTDEEKAQLNDAIVGIADGTLSELPTTIKSKIGQVYQGDIETITPEQQIEILQAENIELNNQVIDLTQKLEIANNKIIELESELATAKTKIEELNATIITLTDQLEITQSENEELKNQLVNAAKEIKKLNAQITAQEAIIKKLNEDNQNNNGQINSLDEKTKTLEQHIEELKAQITTQEKEINDLKAQLEVETYENFEDYVFDGINAPIIKDYNNQYPDSQITAITTSSTNTTYDSITFTSNIAFTNEQMNYLTSLVLKQLSATSYDADITLIFSPNNTTINLSQIPTINPL